jgi:hypothetical protein
MRMAGSVEPSADQITHESKPHLAGSIAMGLAIGAVAGVLVGGLMGLHESSSGSIQVAGASISQPAAP